MKVGDLVRHRDAHFRRHPPRCAGVVIAEPDQKYIRRVSVMWPWGEETLSEKWLEVIDESR